MNEQCEGYGTECNNTYTHCVDNDDKTSPFKYMYYCDICAEIRERAHAKICKDNARMDIEIVA